LENVDLQLALPAEEHNGWHLVCIDFGVSFRPGGEDARNARTTFALGFDDGGKGVRLVELSFPAPDNEPSMLLAAQGLLVIPAL
jgi:hypothetical protein